LGLAGVAAPPPPEGVPVKPAEGKKPDLPNGGWSLLCGQRQKRGDERPGLEVLALGLTVGPMPEAACANV